ncbi:hypothetical protein [Macrococcus capreoli]|uniref:hypothetical protein n=1 Tax=Macrococcus capreoli TaxID=2982690 RepID=UPI003F427D4C
MKVSYDYEDMINELKADIEEGLIDYEDTIRIERGETIIANTTIVEGIAAYSPIIDYLFHGDKEIEGRTYEKMTVKGILFEMEHYNSSI